MLMKLWRKILCLLSVTFATMVVVNAEESKIIRALDIAPVWSAHPVGFCLLTHAPHQYVAYYDAQRRMTVAQRKLDEEKWTYTVLPVTTGWDSHNYVTMAIDAAGYLHLSGDLHCVPLKYFRSEKPHDAASLKKVDQMTGTEESRTTYPKFFTGPGNQLVFTYRDGSSGDGNQIFNVYDVKTQTWKRLLDRPLTDGEGQRNAYFCGPVLGPDGYYHISWVWRETPDASTNHDLSYARSKDLQKWETAEGKVLALPIRLNDGATIDPVPVQGGIINGNHKIGFDAQKRVTISYHKNDQKKHTQPWIARFEDGVWKFHQVTDWPWHWDFSGGGTLNFAVRLGEVTVQDNGSLTMNYRHPEFGSGVWDLDPQTLRARGKATLPTSPKSFSKIEGDFPGLRAKMSGDEGVVTSKDSRFILRWETLQANRDQAIPEPWPKPTMLRLYQIAP